MKVSSVSSARNKLVQVRLSMLCATAHLLYYDGGYGNDGDVCGLVVSHLQVVGHANEDS